MNLFQNYFRELGEELKQCFLKRHNLMVLMGYFVLLLLLFWQFSGERGPAKDVGYWFSFVPPLTAVVFAFVTHRILESLMLSVFMGKLFLWLAASSEGGQEAVAGEPIGATIQLLTKTLSDDFNQKVLVFIVLMLSMISVIICSGGLHAIIEKLAKRARSGKSSQFMAACMGLVIFIDDYANTMIVGSAARPISDRFRVSREKLAFIVDATAAPVAGLALISTWIGYEVGLFGKASQDLGFQKTMHGAMVDVSGYAVFLDVIGYRFYCWMMLIFVFVNILTQRDFSSMLKAERRAWKTGILRDHHRLGENKTETSYGDGIALTLSFVLPLFILIFATSLASLSFLAYLFAFLGILIFGFYYRNELLHLLRYQLVKKEPETDPEPGYPLKMSSALLPFAALFMMMFWGLWKDGGGNQLVQQHGLSVIWSWQSWLDVISKSENNVMVLAQSGLVGLSAAALMAVLITGLPAKRVFAAVLAGSRNGFLPMAILVLAWTLKGICDQVHTGAFLSAFLGENLSVIWFPAAVFLLSGLVAFSTGTSWGTMAILIPTIAPIAFQLDGQQYGLATMLCLGAILDGAIFGDHCSPISDTTVLSSLATSSDHLDHVQTQMPYALTVGALALLLGYLPAALWNVPLYIHLIVALVATVLICRVFGRNPRAQKA